MIFHSASVLLFIFWCQCVGGENSKNIYIESVLDQVSIPSKITNNFLQKSITLPSKKLNSNEYINSSMIHYENSNGFTPVIAISHPHEFRQTKENLTKFSGDSMSTIILKKANVEKNVSLSSKIQKVLEEANLNKNRKSFHIDNEEIDVELLKIGNNTPSIANYSSLYDNLQEFPISNNSHFSENYNKFLRNKDRERGKPTKGNYESENNRNGQHVYDELSESKKIIGDRTKVHYNEDRIKNYHFQKIFLPIHKNNHVIVNTPNSTLKVKTHVKTNEEYKYKKPTEVNQKEPIQFIRSTSNPYINTKQQKNVLNSEEAIYKPISQIEWINRNYEFTNSQSSSEENLDYIDEIDKLHRIKTNKKRYQNIDLSQKIPKEYQQIYNDANNNKGRKYSIARSKSRYRQKPVIAANNENVRDNSNENSNDFINQQNFNEKNTWDQVSKNVEVSNSNGFEINQIEKPKLHIVPINIVSNFDHATALDNSQGFDITNAMFTGFVQDGSLVSTASPLISSTNYVVSSTVKPQIGIAASTPEIIVDQSSFQSPVQTVFVPNKLQQNIINPYVQSISPTVFAVTPSPAYSTSSVMPNLQHMLTPLQNSFPFHQQLVTVKPLHESLTNILYPVQSNTNTKIYVSPNRLQNPNLYSHQNKQLSTNQNNYIRSNSQKKKKVHDNSSEFLASASLSVETNIKDGNINSKSNINDDSHHNTENNQQARHTLKAVFQPTIIPAILHTGISIINNDNHQLIPNPLFLTNSQSNQQIMKVTNDALQNTLKNLQYDVQNNRYQFISGIDSTVAANNINTINNIINPLQKAQLPILGANNVEIINPNLKTNAYAIHQIPNTLLTTQIPIFTTTGLIASKLPFSSSLQESTDDRRLYNPINFLPNYDLIKNQSILNSYIISNDDKKLNFIPLSSIGKLYKNIPGEEIQLINQPKINFDLEKYAEEMFKESLRTIYNSHKWNKDRRSPNNISHVDNLNFSKLRNELFRIRNNIHDSKLHRDVLEADHTENKIRTTNLRSPYKRPNSLNKPYSESIKKPLHYSHHYRQKSKINDFLTPPKINPSFPKNSFNNKPSKRWPNRGLRYNTRPHPRHGMLLSKSKGIEGQSSTVVDFKYPIRSNKEYSGYTQVNNDRLQYNKSPSLATSVSENDDLKSSSEYQNNSFERDFFDINHPRSHNLMGLLMKNNRLPPGT